MILAIDSSGLTASVAVTDEDNDIVTAEYTVNLKKTHSETLLPMIDEIFRLTGIVKSAINAVAIASGPGSFTGLRIGGAAAKGIASALDIPVIPVPTLMGLAYNCYGNSSLICPVMDARRNQTYTGIYEFVQNRADCDTADRNNFEPSEVYTWSMRELTGGCAMDIEALCDKLNSFGRDVMLLGDGVPVFMKVLDEKLTVGHSYAPAGMNRQSAASIGRLAHKLLAEGKAVSAADFAPEYLRQSQAERERNEGSGK